MWNELSIIFQQTDVKEIIILSLYVSTTAILLGSLVGIPIGSFIGLTHFPGRKWVVAIVYTLMGLPPVLIGVIVYILLSRSGPLGNLGLLFTPTAMIIAQVLLVTPIIIGLTMSTTLSKEKAFAQTARSLGASPIQLIKMVMWEARKGILTAVITAYGRAISEVGAVMLVGGNIEHHTRVMTTAIILETRKGNFQAGLALGLILLVISFVINFILMNSIVKNFQNNK